MDYSTSINRRYNDVKEFTKAIEALEYLKLTYISNRYIDIDRKPYWIVRISSESK